MNRFWIRVLPTSVAVLALAGCVLPPQEGGYRSPADRLSMAALEDAASMSYQTRKFLESGNSEQQALEQAKKAVADSLKDPDSAKFRNVSIKPYLEGKVICGEVNGKNSYGGYVGFKRFVASPITSTIQSTGGRYSEVDDLANTGLRAACGG